jgi:tetratricopeptide (TPR) repeat protein
MRPYDLAMARAEALLRAGNSAAAIEPLRDALTADPEQAVPHMLLARALRDRARLTGSHYEANRAIELAPLWAGAHLELAQTLLLQQHRKAALAATDKAIELEPHNAFAHLMRAKLLRFQGRRLEAERSLATALELAPNAPDIIAEQGFAALEQGRIDRVEAAGREILSRNPSHPDGLILTGHARLAVGDGEEALTLALSALANAPNDLEALHLLASAKMRKNPVGGLWWRWNRLLVKLGETRAIFLVVGLWVLYRWSVLASGDLGLPAQAATILTILYLAFVLYTLSAGAIVSRMVAKEVERVRLKPGF